MPFNSNKRINKKVTLIAVLAILALLVGGWYIYNKKQEVPPAAPSQEEIVQKELEELDKLRQQANLKPLTEEETKKQLEELNKLKGQ